MPTREEEFLQTLRATFKVEAEEHLQAIASGLLALEKTDEPGERQKIVETVFRAAHSLKGAARAVNLTQVEAICQKLEDLFSDWKRGKSLPSTQTLDRAHRAVDEVAKELRPAPPTDAPAAAPEQSREPAKEARNETAQADTVRISVSKLDAHLFEAEEMLAVKLAAGQRATELAALTEQVAQWRKDWNPDYLGTLESRLAALRRAAEQDRLTLGKRVDDLLAESKKLLMLPLATVGALFPKLVRDLSRDQGKEVELTVQGDEVEVDKRILEELKDPLIHLLRNSVDHGIETPDQRRQLGKPPRATIALAVSRVNGSGVEIAIRDDGRGIDVEALKTVARQRGVLTPQAASELADRDALALIFEPDISTSPIITELSGRGLGLAIVREKTEKLGGRVSVDSERNRGTTIRLSLPLTLATFRGILLRAAGRLFLLPTAEVERVTRFKSQDIRTVEGRETLLLDGRTVSLVRLADVLQLPAAAQDESKTAMPAVLLGAGAARTAFAVDAVLDEQEVLLKQLGRPLLRVRNIAGAAVLGAGVVAPVLKVTELLQSAKKGGAPLRVAIAAKAAAPAAKSILVAEDSITSRLLLKGILEAAGYRVRTAVDGMEAYTALRAERFDLTISDVEMPRLNGFDLTTRIRADRKLAEMPVVLVTALESREDRERGIEVGANAYLVKSSFDQSNLLEAERRLI